MAKVKKDPWDEFALAENEEFEFRLRAEQEDGGDPWDEFSMAGLSEGQSLDPRVQAERERLHAELNDKYSRAVPGLVSARPAGNLDTYGETPKAWGYYGGTVVHNQPVSDGNLESRVGLDKATAKWANKNNEVNVSIGAGGNHSVKWSRSF